MSVAVDKFQYKLPYATIFGGATALTPEQFRCSFSPNISSFGSFPNVFHECEWGMILLLPRRLNGFSNMFWGWGGEDDDMYNRVHDNGLDIARLEGEGYYKMARHNAEVKNPERFKLRQTGKQR